MNTESEWSYRGDRPEIEACHHMEPKVWRLRQLRRTEDSEVGRSGRYESSTGSDPGTANGCQRVDYLAGGRRWPGFY